MRGSPFFRAAIGFGGRVIVVYGTFRSDVWRFRRGIGHESLLDEE
jgi:hypothetical protein